MRRGSQGGVCVSLRALQTSVLTGPPETLPPELAFWSWEWAEGKGQRPRSEIRALPARGLPEQGVREGRLPSLVPKDPLSLRLALAIAFLQLPTLFWGWGTRVGGADWEAPPSIPRATRALQPWSGPRLS